MATTYENMVLREMHRHEHQSKAEWGKQHAADSTVFGLETREFARLEGLKEKVADLCDLQPTPASMVRPPRKVCATLSSSAAIFWASLSCWRHIGIGSPSCARLPSSHR